MCHVCSPTILCALHGQQLLNSRHPPQQPQGVTLHCLSAATLTTLVRWRVVLYALVPCRPIWSVQLPLGASTSQALNCQAVLSGAGCNAFLGIKRFKRAFNTGQHSSVLYALISSSSKRCKGYRVTAVAETGKSWKSIGFLTASKPPGLCRVSKLRAPPLKSRVRSPPHFAAQVGGLDQTWSNSVFHGF